MILPGYPREHRISIRAREDLYRSAIAAVPIDERWPIRYSTHSASLLTRVAGREFFSPAIAI